MHREPWPTGQLLFVGQLREGYWVGLILDFDTNTVLYFNPCLDEYKDKAAETEQQLVKLCARVSCELIPALWDATTIARLYSRRGKKTVTVVEAHSYLHTQTHTKRKG